MQSTADSSVAGYRLSASQKTLWSLQQTTESHPFTAFGAILIEGPLNARRLQQAVEQLVRRHEILRTTFIRPAGIKTPFQVVAEEPRFLWSDVDVSDLEPTEQELRIAEQIAQHRDRHVDLVDGPVLSLVLIKRAANVQVLLVSLPALCGDSDTLANFTGELFDAYVNELKHKTAVDPMQYADFSEWQHELLEANDENARAGKSHWEDVQAAAGSPLTLPFENRVVGIQRFAPVSIPVELVSSQPQIETLAEEQGTSLSAVLLACWQAVVWRLAGEPDSKFVLYCLSSGRKPADLSDALGLYAKHLPIGCHCKDEAFIRHLRQVSNALAEADKWQEYFEPGTSASIASSVAYDFEERPPMYGAAGLSFSVIEQHTCISPFKLKLSCVQSGTRLSAHFDYDTQFFEAETVKRISLYFQRFLSGVLKSPQSGLGEIDLLDATERQRLLVDLNQTAVAFESNSTKPIHELFEAQVTRTPGALAVVHENQQLTYEQLNSRANQLAHLLRRRGVEPNGCVGLCVDRSAEMVVGILGILKAGGAYVPLNPDHPRERLAMQLAESNARILITSGAQNQESLFAGEKIDLDRERASLETESKHNPSPNTTLENRVYVIYTSGSTGVPKGVSVRHGNLINYTQFILRRLKVDRPLAFATVSTVSADLGNTCIFPALVSGGCVHVIGSEASMESDLLRDYFIRHRIDVLKIVPSHLSALVATQTDGQILPAQYLILGGEALSWDLVQRISRFGGSCQVINHYGPTETTVGSLTCTVDDRFSPYSSTVPIGRPIANTVCYILDRRRRPVPFGVSGELYIGGAGVASGYLNQPAETADRFISDPFASDAYSRLYRTGDLVRYLRDDNIEFLGRIDHQVKVRGFRVELAEIETVLLMHNEVREAVVVAEAATTENQRLVGYVVASGSKPPGIDELRTFLERRLPAYMIPSTFVFLKTMPLTPNGKIDRASLPSPDDARPGLQRLFVAPRTPIEKELAGIWAELLKLNEVGVEDSFFELGGHSLLATQVVSRMRKTFNCEIPLRSLFESPTIAQLAQQIAASRAIESERLLAEIEKLSDEEVETMLKTKEP